MTVGRKRKPTHLKLVTGNPGKRELKPDAIQPPPRTKVLAPPAHLSREAKAEWKRLAPMLTKIGILSDLDRGAFAAYCQAYGRWKLAEDALENLRRKDESGFAGMLVTTKAGNTIQNPLVGIANRSMDMMVKYAAEFGFTPSARARVQDTAPQAAKAKAQSFFDD
jgi:P27 family predicted phage terminase small subunit